MSRVAAEAARRSAAAPTLFGETANPAVYLPRPETERVLARLEAALVDEPGRAALIAPAGLGKSLLLRVLEERIADRLARVYLPYGALALAELCAWALGLLGQPHTEAPLAALQSLAARARPQRRGLLLMIDDANSIPLATARELGPYLRDSGPALRIVLAAQDDARTARVLAALDFELVVCRDLAPLERDESRALISAALERGGAGVELRGRFDASTLARIHGISAGSPRMLQTLANEVARGGSCSTARLCALLELPGAAPDPFAQDPEIELGLDLEPA